MSCDMCFLCRETGHPLRHSCLPLVTCEGLGSAPRNVVVKSALECGPSRQVVSSILGFSARCRDPHTPFETMPGGSRRPVSLWSSSHGLHAAGARDRNGSQARRCVGRLRSRSPKRSFLACHRVVCDHNRPDDRSECDWLNMNQRALQRGADAADPDHVCLAGDTRRRAGHNDDAVAVGNAAAFGE
jgi:hypothetical protein